MANLEQRVSRAVQHFWLTRESQGNKQGLKSGVKDKGSRSQVTGGAQLNGFVQLISELLVESGLPDHSIFTGKNRTVLPGWFRPTKEWDIVVVSEGKLVAIVEFKSQVGSFGNNFNNRTEEAIGNAVDILTAYREGAFSGSAKPWIGYFMLVEDSPGSTSPVAVQEPHFSVFPEFHDSSYAMRYSLLCQKLVRERLYDAACLLLSDSAGGMQGRFREPNLEVGVRNFVVSLTARAAAIARLKN